MSLMPLTIASDPLLRVQGRAACLALSRRPFGRQCQLSLGSPDFAVVPETPRESCWKCWMTCEEQHNRHHRRGSLASRPSSFFARLSPLFVPHPLFTRRSNLSSSSYPAVTLLSFSTSAFVSASSTMSKSSIPSVKDLPSAEELKEDAVVATKQTFASLRSLVAGGAGGVAAVIVGHPFDLVKVRLQTAQAGVYSGAMDVVRRTVAKEGLVRVCYLRFAVPAP